MVIINRMTGIKTSRDPKTQGMAHMIGIGNGIEVMTEMTTMMAEMALEMLIEEMLTQKPSLKCISPNYREAQVSLILKNTFLSLVRSIALT